MIDRFGGKIERAVAAYNAGPHRVAVWNQARPGMKAEEFVDSIPFSETRLYVMTVLAAQEQYRRSSTQATGSSRRIARSASPRGVELPARAR